jgi:hypothetical protein
VKNAFKKFDKDSVENELYNCRYVVKELINLADNDVDSCIIITYLCYKMGRSLGEKKEEGGVASTHTSLNARCMMFTTVTTQMITAKNNKLGGDETKLD